MSELGDLMTDLSIQDFLAMYTIACMNLCFTSQLRDCHGAGRGGFPWESPRRRSVDVGDASKVMMIVIGGFFG